MKPEILPAAVVRANEIHRRQPRVRRVAEIVELTAVCSTVKSRHVARKVRDGLVLRGIVRP